MLGRAKPFTNSARRLSVVAPDRRKDLNLLLRYYGVLPDIPVFRYTLTTASIAFANVYIVYITYFLLSRTRFVVLVYCLKILVNSVCYNFCFALPES